MSNVYAKDVVGKVTFTSSREVSKKFKEILSGLYIISPSTFDVGSETTFVIRIYTKSEEPLQLTLLQESTASTSLTSSGMALTKEIATSVRSSRIQKMGNVLPSGILFGDERPSVKWEDSFTKQTLVPVAYTWNWEKKGIHPISSYLVGVGIVAVGIVTADMMSYL